MTRRAKGREREKTGKGGTRGKSNERSRSTAARPPTRRNLNDTPEKSKSADRGTSTPHPPKEQVFKKKIVAGCEQHEYLQFSLRITEDIISNNLYGNEEMLQVLNSHYTANKGRLDKDKMVAAIIQLCKELTIPVKLENNHFVLASDVPRAEKSVQPCICGVPSIKIIQGLCECVVERPPPIPCAVHSHEGKLSPKRKRSPKSPKRKKSPRSRSPSPKTSKHPTERPQSPKQQETLSAQPLVPKQPPASPVSDKGRDKATGIPEINKVVIAREDIGDFVADSSRQVNEIGTGTEMPVKNEPHNIEEIEKELVVVKPPELEVIHNPVETCGCPSDECVISEEDLEPNAKCTCESPSCDPSVCDILPKKETPIVSITIPSLIEDIVEEVVIEEAEGQDEDSLFDRKYCICGEADCVEDRMKKFLEYYDKTIKRAKHIPNLQISHQMYFIEPKETVELSIQTSLENICAATCTSKTFPYKFEELSRAKPETIPKIILPPSSERPVQDIFVDFEDFKPMGMARDAATQNESIGHRQYAPSSIKDGEFIILEGPIFIPKSTVEKKAEVLPLIHPPEPVYHQTPMFIPAQSQSQMQPNYCMSSSGYVSKDSSSNKPDFLPSYGGVRVKKRIDLPQFVDCYYRQPTTTELWGARERNFNDYDLTPQREDVCRATETGCQCGTKTTLLLGNQYDAPRKIPNENLSLYYPSMATQVSSFDFLQPPTSTRKPSLTSNVPARQEIINPIDSTVAPKQVSVIPSGTEQQQAGGEVLASEEVSEEESVRKQTFYEDVLDKLDRTRNVGSSDSIEKRILNLATHMEKYREGDEEYLPNISRNQQELSVDVSIKEKSIAEDLEQKRSTR